MGWADIVRLMAEFGRPEWEALHERHGEALRAILEAKAQVNDGTRQFHAALGCLGQKGRKGRLREEDREKLPDLGAFITFLADIQEEADDLDEELSAIVIRESLVPAEDTKETVNRVHRRALRLVRLIQWDGLFPWGKRLKRIGRERVGNIDAARELRWETAQGWRVEAEAAIKKKLERSSNQGWVALTDEVGRLVGRSGRTVREHFKDPRKKKAPP